MSELPAKDRLESLVVVGPKGPDGACPVALRERHERPVVLGPDPDLDTAAEDAEGRRVHHPSARGSRGGPQAGGMPSEPAGRPFPAPANP